MEIQASLEITAAKTRFAAEKAIFKQKKPS